MPDADVAATADASVFPARLLLLEGEPADRAPHITASITNFLSWGLRVSPRALDIPAVAVAGSTSPCRASRP